MNKTKKRRLSLLSILLAIATVSCPGCSTGQSGSDTPTPSGTSSQSNADESAIAKYLPQEGKTYQIDWLSMQAQPVENDAPLVQHWNEEFGVELNIVNIADAEALNIKIAAGDAPDYMNVTGKEKYRTFVEDQIFAELPEELLSTVAPNLYQKLAEETEGYWDEPKIDGKIYGIVSLNPWNKYRYPIVWNGVWLEKIGMTEAPVTFDEMNEALYAFANEDPDGNGQDDTYGLSLDGMQLVFSAFGQIVPDTGIFWTEKDGEVVPTLLQPEAKEALAYLHQLYVDGVLNPEFVTGENQGGYWALTHQFINGQIGLTCKGSHYHWTPGDPERDYAAAGANWQAVYEIDPETAKKITFGDPIINPQGTQIFSSNGGQYGYQYFCINQSVAEEEPDKVGKILSILDAINATDAHTLSTAIYGIEGEHWEYQEIGGVETPVRNAGRLASDDIAVGGNTLMFAQPPLSIYSKAYPENFVSGDTYGFDKFGVTTAVQEPLSSYAQYQAELDKIKSEAYYAIIRGERPIDSFDDFVEEWLAAGGNEVIAEAQALSN